MRMRNKVYRLTVAVNLCILTYHSLSDPFIVVDDVDTRTGSSFKFNERLLAHNAVALAQITDGIDTRDADDRQQNRFEN